MGRRTIRFWVTANNHKFISDISGLPIEKIQKKYEAARRKGLVCTMQVRKSSDEEDK